MVALTFYTDRGAVGQIMFCETCLKNPAALNGQMIEEKISFSLPKEAVNIRMAIENLKVNIIFKRSEQIAEK